MKSERVISSTLRMANVTCTRGAAVLQFVMLSHGIARFTRGPAVRAVPSSHPGTDRGAGAASSRLCCQLLHAQKKPDDCLLLACMHVQVTRVWHVRLWPSDLPWSLHSSSHADNNVGAPLTPLASSQASSTSQVDLGLISLDQTRLLGRPLNVPIPHS